MKIMKGAEIDGILEVESADVVELPAAKKKKQPANELRLSLINNHHEDNQ